MLSPKIVDSVDMSSVDNAFRMAQSIVGSKINIHLWDMRRDGVVDHAHAPSPYSFDHEFWDGRSALLLLAVSRGADLALRYRSSRLAPEGASNERFPRFALRRMFTRCAFLIRSSEVTPDPAYIFVSVPLTPVPSVVDGYTRVLVRKLHSLCLSNRRGTHSAILIPVDARASSLGNVLGNLSSSELSVCVDVRRIAEDVEVQFARLDRARFHSLKRLARYGGLPPVARRLVCIVSRLFKLPKESAIVSRLNMTEDLKSVLGEDIFFQVPHRHRRSIAVGIVRYPDRANICISGNTTEEVLSGFAKKLFPSDVIIRIGAKDLG